MRKFLPALCALSLAASIAKAQAPQQAPPKNTQKISPGRIIHTDTAVVTKHTVTIKGQAIQYTATAGMIPVWDEDGRPTAGVFYTYYERDGIQDRANRPLEISFNGGPGTPSVWMELGYTGPRMLNADDEGYPTEPYGFKENQNSILDVADIVYIDPVNTGYSRTVTPETPKAGFFGVNEDIHYLAEWINTFVTRQNRWASPGGGGGGGGGAARAAGRALALQDNEWMYLNGVILVSPTDLGINRSGPVSDALRLPYFAATAWYHKKMAADLQSKDLTTVLPEIEDFTVNEYIPALSRGGSLSDDQKKAIAAKVARYSGLSQKVVEDNNLVISYNLFWKELLRDQGYTVGRLDSSYRGIDKQTAGDGPDYN